MLTVGVVSLDTKNSAALLAMLQQTGLVQPIAQWDLMAGEGPTARAAVPDVVLVEIGRDSKSPLEFAARLNRLNPAACIIACSAYQEPSPELLMQAMRSGVREFLSQPIDPMVVREMLERLVNQRGMPNSEMEKLLIVTGAKGGVGTTTVAVNLAVQLARSAGKRVVLLDLGRPLGHASLLLDLEARFSFRAAVESLDRLDSHLFSGLLANHKSGVQLLAGASHADEWDRISPQALARIINVAQSSFDFVVADVGPNCSSEWSSVLRLARQIVLVTETNVPSLWSLERQITLLRALGIDSARLRVAVNRWHKADEGALESFEKRVKLPIFERLPNDFKAVSRAVNMGAELSPGQNVQLLQKFRSMAEQFSGVRHESDAKRGSFLGIFSSRK
ncbi:MAG: AAA family ATPase [Acidobacteriota bacterium]|nr:AAA family ATPase [Acidobacteriota bacterium]